jgi:hypothetical protein
VGLGGCKKKQIKEGKGKGDRKKRKIKDESKMDSIKVKRICGENVRKKHTVPVKQRRAFFEWKVSDFSFCI